MSEFRVRQDGDQFHAEQRYVCGHLPGMEPKEMWIPLNTAGFWADPDAFAYGLVRARAPMSETQAKQAIWRAQLIERSAA